MRRILHALGLGFLQPVVPLCLFVGLGSLLLNPDGTLRPPGLPAFVATLLVPLVPNALLIGLALVAFGRVSPRELGWIRPERPLRETALGFAGLAAYLAVFAMAVWFLDGEPRGVIATIESYPLSSRFLLLLVGIHIAFFEESVFRGYLQPAIIAKLGLWGGVVATAVVFAAWHPPHFHLPGFVIRLGLGLVTGALRGADRPLLAPFVAHALLWAVVGLS